MRWDAKVLGKVRTEIRFRVQHNYNWMACRVIPLVAQWKRDVEFIAVESLHVARLESQNVCPPPPPPMDEISDSGSATENDRQPSPHYVLRMDGKVLPWASAPASVSRGDPRPAQVGKRTSHYGTLYSQSRTVKSRTEETTTDTQTTQAPRPNTCSPPIETDLIPGKRARPTVPTNSTRTTK